MKTTRKAWLTIAELPTIDWDDAAVAVSRTPVGLYIVRRTTTNEAAVIAVDGRLNKIVKVLPTVDRARAYLAALSR
jgi:hypothetical protein